MSNPMPQSLDQRRYAPATERNRTAIGAVLAAHLPTSGTVLEIASGTGQHATFLAPQLAPRHWLPSDPDPTARESIRGWLATAPSETLYEPLALDVTQPRWPTQVSTWQKSLSTVPPLAAIVNINMIHISPWAACNGLFAGAASLLPTDGIVYLYGPFKQQGQHTAPSNEAFDHSLRSQNPAWGVRDLGAVTELARKHGFELVEVIAMPANNLSVIFKAAKS